MLDLGKAGNRASTTDLTTSARAALSKDVSILDRSHTGKVILKEKIHTSSEVIGSSSPLLERLVRHKRMNRDQQHVLTFRSCQVVFQVKLPT